jgi:hypothetical protein
MAMKSGNARPSPFEYIYAELWMCRRGIPLTELQLAQAIIRHMTRRIDLLKMWPVVLAAIWWA